jgi:hypothetical protein
VRWSQWHWDRVLPASLQLLLSVSFFNGTAPTEIYTLLFPEAQRNFRELATLDRKVLCFGYVKINPLNAELNPIRHLLAFFGAHPILHVSRIRVNISIFFGTLSGGTQRYVLRYSQINTEHPDILQRHVLPEHLARGQWHQQMC